MTTVILYVVIAVLVGLVGFLGNQLYKFAKIIMVFEDNLSSVIQSISEAENSLETILELKLFFDSPEIQEIITQTKETVRYSKIKINAEAAKFLELSNNKYVSYVEEDAEVENELSEPKLSEEDRIKNSVRIPRFTTPRHLPARFQDKIE
jgi:hypothetical protein